MRQCLMGTTPQLDIISQVAIILWKEYRSAQKRLHIAEAKLTKFASKLRDIRQP